MDLYAEHFDGQQHSVGDCKMFKCYMFRIACRWTQWLCRASRDTYRIRMVGRAPTGPPLNARLNNNLDPNVINFERPTQNFSAKSTNQKFWLFRAPGFVSHHFIITLFFPYEVLSTLVTTFCLSLSLSRPLPHREISFLFCILPIGQQAANPNLNQFEQLPPWNRCWVYLICAIKSKKKHQMRPTALLHYV